MLSSWQLSRKTIKRIRIGGIVVAVLLFLWYLPFLLFQLELGRKGGADYVAKELSKTLGTEVELEEVSMTLSGDVKATALSVKDSLGEEALSAESLVLDLSSKNIWKYLKSKTLDLDHIRLFSPKITLREDSLGRLNIAPILEHLKSDKQTEEEVFNLSVYSILLRNASCLYYREENLLFGVEELDCKLDELELKGKEGQQVSVRELSFKLANGFRVKNFSSLISVKKDALKVQDLDLLFGESQINIPKFILSPQRFGLSKLDTLDIAQINVALKDLAPFHQAFATFGRERLRGRAKLSNKLNTLELETLKLTADKLFKIKLAQGKAKLSLVGAPLSADLSDIDLSLSRNFWQRLKAFKQDESKARLIEDLSLLGACQWRGNAHWTKNEKAKLKGKLSTERGEIDLNAGADIRDGNLQAFRGELQLEGLNLAKYREEELDLSAEKADFYCEGEKDKSDDSWKLTTKLAVPSFTLRGKDYENLSLEGDGAHNRYHLDLELDDKLVQIATKLSLLHRAGQTHNINLDYKLDGVKPHDWGIKLGKAGCRYDLDGRLELARLKPRLGDLLLDVNKLAWQDEDGEVEQLEDLSLVLKQDKAGATQCLLQAPWVEGLIKSNCPLELLPKKIERTLYRQVPLIAHWGGKGKKATALVDIKLDSLPKALDKLVKLPLSSDKPIRIKGDFDEAKNRFALLVKGDDFKLGEHRFHATELKLSEHNLQLVGDIYLNNTSALRGASLDLSQRNNDFALSMNLGQDKEGRDNGELNSNVQIASPKDLPKKFLDLNMLIGLRPSKLRIHNREWKLSPAELLLSKEASYVKGLKLASENRSLAIDGMLSNNPNDSLHVALKNVSLLYILSAAKVKFSMLDAELSGDLYAKVKDKVFYAFGDVKSDEFFVNGYDAGASNLHLDWDTKSNFLGINGYLGNYDHNYTEANGGINLGANSGIDILFTAHKLKLGFIQAFTDGFLSKLQGAATGKIRLFGIFRDGVTIAGEADVQDAELGIKSLGTVYRFSDKLKFDADEMIFPNIKLTDARGQTALFNGTIKHNNFQNMVLDLNFTDLDKFKILKNENVRTLPVCGEAYCSGKASLTGSKGKLLLSLDAKTESPSDLSIDINALNMVWRDQSLMRFVSLRDSLPKPKLKTKESKKKTAQSLLDMELNLDIDAGTQLGIRLGNDRSDEIKARGEGHLEINVPFIGDQTMYGDFKLLSGEYTLRLENLTNKKFKVRSGSMLNFRGNPAHANIDIDAIYSLTANISDLDEGLAYGTQRTNMPVNCVLSLGGELSRPKLSFGITLPKASGEVERSVKALLSTEEAMTRQTLALISIGKFMPSAYGKTDGTGTDNWTALASTTISEQLSALLGDLSEKIQLGTSIKTRNQYFTDTEIELLFSGQLFNDRLSISGNVGYHDNPFLSNTYIGEFDLEYKLNKSGSLRLKGYNHYNNSYQYIRKGLTTQGFGLLFRKRFDKLSDLFKSKKQKNKERKAK